MSSDIRWRGLDHPAIHKMINAGPGANASDAPADFWGTLSNGLNEISSTLHKKLGDLDVHWQGVSADQALAGMTPLKEWAAKAQSGSNVMKSSFELQGNYVGDARAEVPPPKEVTTPAPSGWQIAGAVGAAMIGNAGPAAAVAAQSADHEAQERAQDEAARQAVQAMEKYESSSEWNADTLGHFEDPPKLVVETPPPAPGMNQSVVETSGMYNSTGVHHNQTSTSSVHHTPIGSQTGTGPGPNVSPQTFTPPQTTNPNNYPTPIQGYPTPPQNHNPVLPPGQKPPFPPPLPPNVGGQNGPWTGPGPFPPGTGPYNTGPGGQNSNSGPRHGLPGTGGGSGTGGPNSGGGRGGLGGNPNAGFGQNSSMMDDGRQGRPGMGGNPMLQEGAARPGGPAGNMGPGGRGAQGGMAPGGRAVDGEEDTEHETPDYLMETDDIFGDERLIAPSVIGEKPEQ
ncbi:PPE domain-containing protein [Kibdelosporangium persicum]|uniref:Translation initiation factor 2 n=1 Tax=Kibdelosporangium persicum TaxID=2698649 RepID=A0ABX2EXG8_9PSEU|nr:PPE domain-containing protein [Kibdelosporangium persicum]NRN63746.1 Translation initiation factor 2 [Kibdelosporangium persicum]